MDPKGAYIIEALKMQPLSEEEKAQRRILGRLYGPIATCKEKTRNGRGYNKELWEKALADDIFNEKVANKSLFLELGHPADREETDMTCICACIPEVPKIIGDDLYAYVDILDTPNGRLLKTLCDYGFVPGISSRGSGDVMANNEVDPETFFLETWDIVQLPAVKKARLSMCEGLDSSNIKLGQALKESYEKAGSEEKSIIKEAAENLGLDIDIDKINVEGEMEDKTSCNESVFEDILADTAADLNIKESTEANCEDEVYESKERYKGGTPKNIDEIPHAPEDTLNEAAEDEEEVDIEEEAEESVDETDGGSVEITDEIPDEIVTADEETDEEVNTDLDTAGTIGEMIDQFKEFDPELQVEFDTIKIGDKEYEVTEMTLDDSEEGKILVGLTCAETDAGAEEDIEVEEAEAETVETDADETDEEVAEDDGTDTEEVVESVKDLVRANGELEAAVKDLKNAKAVGDAKVKELTEELNKYKEGFKRTSKIAAETPKLKQDVQTLTEQLKEQTATVKTLQEKLNVVKSDTAKEAAGKTKSLTEQLRKAEEDANATVQSLKEDFEKQKQELQRQQKLANSYKNKCAAIVERYILSKASMLGVKPSEIKSRLNEKYSLDDIDNVCNNLLSESVPAFSLGRNASMRINESRSSKPASTKYQDPSCGYEIDDDLLILAGLKDQKF